MNVNFAERAHNHNWKLDPIVRSLLDTDFYKLLMLQFIWKNFPGVQVTSEVYNRTVQVRLAERVGAAALREQMEHVRGLRFRKSELVWLAGNTFYGVRSIFEPAFLEWLERDFILSEYEIAEEGATGQLVLKFAGSWTAVTMWEVYALAIVSELKTRTALAELSELELDVLYARAKTRLWDKIEKLRVVQGAPAFRLSGRDGGTRFCGRSMRCSRCGPNWARSLPAPPTCTSRTSMIWRPSATNAHELPMALAALASTGSDEQLRQSQIPRAGTLAAELRGDRC